MNYLSIVLVVFSLIFINLIICYAQEFAPIITAKTGKLRGIVKTLDDGTKVNLYEGIPYGKPPVGELRFSKPIAVSAWTDVYNATQYRFMCMQPDTIEPDNNIPEETLLSEDCLFLNVWLPSNSSANNKSRSVMVWFHGGGFETGTIFSLAYDARYLVAYGDVIVVTVNYRVGPFGFLYAGSNDTQGNAGLYDQILAIKWVFDNIAAFGGDPDTIAVFGESAGGMSVGALILSPLSHGLIKRGIMQSGGPNSYLGSESKESAIEKTKTLAKTVKCPLEPIADMIKCLKTIDPIALVNVTKKARGNGETFLPIYGDELMPLKPTEALKTGKFNQNLDLLFGTVSNEGALFAESIYPTILNPLFEKNLTNITVAIANQSIQFLFLLFHEKYGLEVANYYLTNLTDSDKDSLRRAITHSFGDYHITCPTVLFGSAYAQWNNANKAYAFRFSHPPSISVFYLCGRDGKWMDVCHGDDVVFVFGFPIKLRGIGFTENDYRLSVDTINVWSTFAKTGVPPKVNNVEWVEAIDRTQANPTVRVMDLNPRNYTILKEYYKDSCEGFWKKHLFV